MINEIIKYRNKEQYDYNCSEIILRSANDYFGLGLTEQAFKMVAPFGGGMFEREVCGILSSALTVLGILFTDTVAHQSPILHEAVLLYKSKFRSEYNTTNCLMLVETYRDEVTGCSEIILKGGLLLQEVVEEMKKKYQL